MRAARRDLFHAQRQMRAWQRSRCHRGNFSARNGRAAGRGGRGDPAMKRAYRAWTIAVRHRAGSLDMAVARARTRNLIASLVLVGLLGRHGVGFGAIYGALAAAGGNAVSFRGRGVARSANSTHGDPRRGVQPGGGVVKEPAAVGRYCETHSAKCRRTTSMIENVLAFSASLHSERAGTGRGVRDRRSAGTCGGEPWRRRSNRPAAASR